MVEFGAVGERYLDCRATFDKDGKKLLDKDSRGVCLRSYRDAMQELSVELGCDFIDMNEMTSGMRDTVSAKEGE